MMLVAVKDLSEQDPLFHTYQQALEPLLQTGGPQDTRRIHAARETAIVFLPEERALLPHSWQPLGQDETGMYRYRTVLENPALPGPELAGVLAARVAALVA